MKGNNKEMKLRRQTIYSCSTTTQIGKVKTIEKSIGEEEELIKVKIIHEIEQWFPTVFLP